MPVHTCCRKHNKATIAAEKQNGMKGDDRWKNEEQNTRREPHTTKKTYNTHKNK